MKLWLDDVREPVNKSWQWVKTGEEAIELLKQGTVETISFDHDLGEGISGYDVAKWIEEMAAHGGMDRISWHIHSANTVGRKNIEAAMRSTERFWHDVEEPEDDVRGGREEWR